MMTGFGMGFGVLGFFLMALFWIVIIAGAVWLIGSLFPRTGGGSQLVGDTPLEILKRRYARGELTKEEYEAIRRDLEA